MRVVPGKCDEIEEIHQAATVVVTAGIGGEVATCKEDEIRKIHLAVPIYVRTGEKDRKRRSRRSAICRYYRETDIPTSTQLAVCESGDSAGRYYLSLGIRARTYAQRDHW